MALSNIFREPRRELTEQFAGFVVFAAIFGLDLPWALWFARNAGLTPFGPALGLGLIIGVLIGLFSFAVFGLLMHVVGEGICNALARRGLELRPMNRPRR